MMIPMIKKEIWATFGDLYTFRQLQTHENSWSPAEPYEEVYVDSTTLTDDMKLFLDTCQNQWTGTYAPKLLGRLYARFFKQYVCSVKWEKESDAPSVDDYQSDWNGHIRDLAYKMTNIFMMTKDRYETLLNIYKDELDNLLEGVKTTTHGTGQFNDTPQNVQNVAEAFGDGSHVSNITKSDAEAVSDVDTKINRIDEIQKKVRNIWKDWIDEFKPLFIARGNI